MLSLFPGYRENSTLLKVFEMNLKLNNYSYLTPSPAVLDGLDYLPDAGNKPSRGRSSIIIIEKVGKYCSSHQLESIDCTICTICTLPVYLMEWQVMMMMTM